ncbi:MAG: protein translocase subunit SecF [Veillonella sp.]|nr:protein translocase subunit SecF [Veillonella sp.]
MTLDVIKHHRWWFAISSTLVIISLISIFTKGFNFGIDYTGGTIVEVVFDQPVEVSQVRDVLKEYNLENAQIQLSGDTTGDTAGEDVMIRTRNLESSESAAVVDSLTKFIGNNTVKRIETVGAVIGSEVTEHALLNLVIAFAALAHLIMVLGVFSYFQLEIDASFLAAILTVVGYSMNESVVIFDRVRENTHTHKRSDTFADLANASITQSIHRSFYTLATVMFACVSLYLFGGDTTKNFALCMIIGFASGAYSSICVATSLWVMWKSRNKNDVRNQ